MTQFASCRWGVHSKESLVPARKKRGRLERRPTELEEFETLAHGEKYLLAGIPRLPETNPKQSHPNNIKIFDMLIPHCGVQWPNTTYLLNGFDFKIIYNFELRIKLDWVDQMNVQSSRKFRAQMYCKILFFPLFDSGWKTHWHKVSAHQAGANTNEYPYWEIAPFYPRTGVIAKQTTT